MLHSVFNEIIQAIHLNALSLTTVKKRKRKEYRDKKCGILREKYRVKVFEKGNGESYTMGTSQFTLFN